MTEKERADDDTVIVFISKEGDEFLVPYSAGRISDFVMNINDDYEDTEEVEKAVIPFSKTALQKAIDFCAHYHTDRMNDIAPPFQTDDLANILQPWYYSFVQVDTQMLLELVDLANFLCIKPLLQLCCLVFSRLIVGKNHQEVRLCMGMSGEWSEENKREIMEKNARALGWTRDIP